ncbi:MAG TPA: SDR family oxidoreductase [Dongiaceae bacterium]|nr:SDR family oxidoreductase [Dongiaceae bacterium]
MTIHSTVLITGAGSGIAATYADRFACRGHDLVLVDINEEHLKTHSDRLRQEHGISVDTIRADLTQPSDLTVVEARLREDDTIGTLINCAGILQKGSFIEQTADSITRLVSLNGLAYIRLANAIAPRLVQAGAGGIINICSVVGLAPEVNQTVYGATKAFVLFFSEGLNLELSPSGVRVQAVLPAETHTAMYDDAGIDPALLHHAMDVGELVDAALVGFDRGEHVTIPPLHDAARWDAFDVARQGLLADLRTEHAAERYRTSS